VRAKFIKFRMRSNMYTCLENSPSMSKFNKPKALGLNYIVECQKVAALEVMQIFFKGEFENTLKAISNNAEYVEKFKNNFETLARLMLSPKAAQAIEFIFVALSSHNESDLGDWIIEKFLDLNRHNKKQMQVLEMLVNSNKSKKVIA
jgi:hypothetical protein